MHIILSPHCFFKQEPNWLPISKTSESQLFSHQTNFYFLFNNRHQLQIDPPEFLPEWFLPRLNRDSMLHDGSVILFEVIITPCKQIRVFIHQVHIPLFFFSGKFHRKLYNFWVTFSANIYIFYSVSSRLDLRISGNIVLVKKGL